MRQRLDITDVEAGTKIRAKYLRALENEDFGMLPGSTFVKSFLRTYAEFLGLDPHLLVREYGVRHDPSYVCVDKGAGTKVVYEGTLAGPKSWKARHLRVNLGRRAVRITVNGKRVVVPTGTDPIGYDFRPRSRHVIAGTRPCG